MGWLLVVVMTVALCMVAERCSDDGCRTGLVLCWAGLVLVAVATFLALSRGTMLVEREPTVFDSVREELRGLGD